MLNKDWSRRAFLAAMAAGASGLTHSNVVVGRDSRQMTIQEVMDVVLEQIPGERYTDTVDTIKAGDPSVPVRGIATTFLATTDVIERAAAQGANLIMTHEPTYYNHLDQTDWLEDDSVYAHKRRLLEEHGIVVWRFHDYWHRYKPDGILTGMLKALGWEDNVASEADRLDLPSVVRVPSTTVSELVGFFKEKLSINRPVQVIGDPDQNVRNVGLLLGAYGVRSQTGFLRNSDIDVLVVGEISEWETSIYVQDARSEGRDVSLIMLGHVVSEEPGMAWLAEWLRPLLPGVPVTHVPTHDPFHLL